MTSSIRLGRIAGIEIGLNWTWFIVFALITWSLAGIVFPNQNPGLSDEAYLVMGLVAAAAFFLSILLHELGHALQARRDDVEIEGITLWLFGGVAKFRNLYGTPGAEFRIAVAGPLVTVAIVVALGALVALTQLPTGVDGVVTWLAYINLLVLVFNLLPALPLDGGRILHAGLWQLKGDLMWATQVGTTIAVAFGWLMIGGGIVLFFTAAAFGGLWLAFIGWFLMTAARGEAQHLAARRALAGLRVRDLMAPQPVSVAPDMLLGHFVDEVASRSRFTTYPVEEHGRALGLLPLDAVARVPRPQWDKVRVRDCMVPIEEVPVVRADDETAELLPALAGGGVSRALVVEDDTRLVGLLSISDMVRAVQLDGFGRGGREQERSPRGWLPPRAG
jgi:Zn-dependent protease/CBS domain-containing protein